MPELALFSSLLCFEIGFVFHLANWQHNSSQLLQHFHGNAYYYRLIVCALYAWQIFLFKSSISRIFIFFTQLNSSNLCTVGINMHNILMKNGLCIVILLFLLNTKKFCSWILMYVQKNFTDSALLTLFLMFICYII